MKLMRVAAIASLALCGTASAALLNDVVTYQPVMNAGAPPDSPANRVDPNLATSPFSGVVSINIRYDGLSFICSGTMISSRHVLTAGHCVDTTDQGNVIDITKPGNDVRAVFPGLGAGGTNAIITASKVTMHPNYNGFGICPPGSGIPGQCLNDDLAILELSAPAPAGAKVYGVSPDLPSTGSVFTMVGYGRSGDGLAGYTVNPSFTVKRKGGNVFDVFDTNDEEFYDPNSAEEVWYYDFDGTVAGFNRDAWCEFAGVCSEQLANGVETHLGGGDSGGPSFMIDEFGNYFLVANNTFGGNVCGWPSLPDGSGPVTPCVNGDFGDIGGGILIASYYAWITQTVPEPGSLALMGVALLALAGAGQRRRR